MYDACNWRKTANRCIAKRVEVYTNPKPSRVGVLGAKLSTMLACLTRTRAAAAAVEPTQMCLMNHCPFTPSPCCLQGSTWLITGFLRTLTFISNPYGMALLVYLSAGLAGFSGCSYLIYLFTQLRDFLKSFGERKFLSLFISWHSLLSACLLIVQTQLRGRSQGEQLESRFSWLHAFLAGVVKQQVPSSIYLFVSSDASCLLSILSSFSPIVMCSLVQTCFAVTGGWEMRWEKPTAASSLLPCIVNYEPI